MKEYLNGLLIGPRFEEKERLDNINPADLYLMGMIHPVDVLEEEEVMDENDTDEVLFQSKPPSLGMSFYLEGDASFNYEIGCAQYTKVKVVNPIVIDRMIHALGNDKVAQIEELQEIKLKEDLTREDIQRLKELHDDLRKGKKEEVIKESWLRVPYNIEAEIGRPDDNKADILIFDDKVRLNTIWRPFQKGYLVTVTMINNLKKNKGYIEDQLFQSSIRVIPKDSEVLPYPGEYDLSYDQEEEELSLIYRNKQTYAIGHSCAATWIEQDGKVTSLETEFLPSVNVKPVTTRLKGDIDDTVLSLQYLSDIELSKDILQDKLMEFIGHYRRWEEGERRKDIGDRSYKAKERILARIQSTIERMEHGVETIVSDDLILESFKIANLAMLMQMVHGSTELSSIKDKDEVEFSRPDYLSDEYREYRWRPFQLAFFLLTIESVVNKESPDRDVVDLIWFPTGGGKTEAYLAVSAFELFYRRLKYGPKGGGTAIIKRYTLRLLTSQQFQRASALICACEVLRREDENRFGLEPFSIGLWVGGDSSPNKFSDAYDLYQRTLDELSPDNRFQVQKCPWCGTRLIPRTKEKSSHYGMKVTENSFSFYCPTRTCDFHEHLPMNVVDEALYREPPSFIIGTVDKFARLAWDERPKVFFGIEQDTLPPSLVIQDELHLISGPLGTIAGIYEAAIDTVLSTLDARPKTIAATATIRRADDQIQRLFASRSNIFPPIGVDSEDSYFARVDKDAPGRMYLGIMSQSGTQTSAIVDIATALAQAPIELELSEEVKDAYWTQVIYHNSKKELGKTITMSSDDIPNRLQFIAKDQSRMRKIRNVVELSGNLSGDEMTARLEQMQVTYDKDGSIDILPCTNVISVGVDVSRLGLMLMHGQPKTTAEYIQASSRVGRSIVPGIVVTVYPSANPRNRSHYENFIPYHESLYRYVEPTSVTPYAAPARDRALHAALVIVMRHAGGLGDEQGASRFDPEKKTIKTLMDMLLKRMQEADPTESKGIENDLYSKVEEWKRKIIDHGDRLVYNARSGRQFIPLLSNFEDPLPRGWPTLNSMRGVDAEIEIVIDGERLEDRR
jgi:hypothetical protein